MDNVVSHIVNCKKNDFESYALSFLAIHFSEDTPSNRNPETFPSVRPVFLGQTSIFQGLVSGNCNQSCGFSVIIIEVKRFSLHSNV